MKEKGYCHTDLKPENTQLVRVDGTENQYCLKIIDFGSVRKNDLKYPSCTGSFFKSPLRNYDAYGNVKF
jgi:serine/threonine protein kinase